MARRPIEYEGRRDYTGWDASVMGAGGFVSGNLDDEGTAAMKRRGWKLLVGTGLVSVLVALFLPGCPRVTIVTVEGQDAGRALSLTVGTTAALQARSSSFEDAFSWVSSAPDVATVDAAGLVTAVAPGMTFITVTGSASHASDSVLLFVTPDIAGGAEVDWLPGETGPENWSIIPIQPTASDIVHFSGPTAGYENVCMAVTATGIPRFTVNSAAHSIQLVFDLAPVKRCANVLDPVCGLTGSIGPLPGGDWVFSGHNGNDALISFEIHFHVGPHAPENSPSVDWVAGETGPAGWSLLPPAPTSADTLRFSGPTTVYSSTCVAIDSVGAPHLVIDPAARTVELAFEPRLIMPCVMIYDPVCGLDGSFGPLAEGDWVFLSHSVHDDLISFNIPFHVGPSAAANRVSASWISGETGPAAWTAETLSSGVPLNGIHLAGPTPLFPSPCDGEAALGGSPFISIDQTAHALALNFQGPPPQVCYDIYAPVCGLQADVPALENGVWTFSAPMLSPPVHLLFIIGREEP